MRVIVLLCCCIVQATIISGFNRYLGCFIDQIDSRDLELFINDNEQLTPAQCILACQQLDYYYAAIQYGTECRCGHQYGKYGRVSDDECRYSCSTGETCGGDGRNSIYTVDNSTSLSQTDPACLNTVVGYQGCFDGVTLDTSLGVVNSIEECVSYCVSNYNYAGIMNNNLCYCGNDLNRPSIDSVLCNLPCPQSLSDTTIDCCGGLHALSIYNVKYYQSPGTYDVEGGNIRVRRQGSLNDLSSMSTSVTSSPITSSSVSSTISITTNSLTFGITSVSSVETNSPSASTLLITSGTQLVSSTIHTSDSSTSHQSSASISNTISTAPLSSTNMLGDTVTTSMLTPSATSTIVTTTAIDSAPTSLQSSSVVPTSTEIQQVATNSMASTMFSYQSTTIHDSTLTISMTPALSSTASTPPHTASTEITNTPTIATMPTSQSSMHSDTSQTIIYLATTAVTTESVSTSTLLTPSSLYVDSSQTSTVSILSSSLHSDTSQMITSATVTSPSSAHSDTTVTSTAGMYLSSSHTGTSQTIYEISSATTETSSIASASHSSAHTDTSSIPFSSAVSSSLHTETSPVTSSSATSTLSSMLSSQSSVYVDTSQGTSISMSSSLHTDTSAATSSLIFDTVTMTSASPIATSSAALTHTDSSTISMATSSISSPHTDTSQTVGSSISHAGTSDSVSPLTMTSGSSVSHGDTSSSLHTDTSQTISSTTMHTDTAPTSSIISASQSSVHTDTSEVTGSSTANLDTTFSSSSITLLSSTISHTDTSPVPMTSVLYSSSHIDTSQTVNSATIDIVTMSSVSSVSHTDTSFTADASISSSSLHTDTSPSVGSSTVHTDTVPTSSVVPTSQSTEHTDTSQRTSDSASSATHMDTSETIESSTVQTITTPYSLSSMLTSQTSSHTDTIMTTIPTSAASVGSSASSHTDTIMTIIPTSAASVDSSGSSYIATILSTSMYTDTSQSSATHFPTGSTLLGGDQSTNTIITDTSTLSSMAITDTITGTASSSHPTSTVSVMATSISSIHSGSEATSMSFISPTLLSTEPHITTNTITAQTESMYSSQSATYTSEGSSVTIASILSTSGISSSSGTSPHSLVTSGSASSSLHTGTSTLESTMASTTFGVTLSSAQLYTAASTIVSSFSSHTDTSNTIVVSTESIRTTVSTSSQLTTAETSASLTISSSSGGTVSNAATSATAATPSVTIQGNSLPSTFSSIVVTATTASGTVASTPGSASIASISSVTGITLQTSVATGTIASTTPVTTTPLLEDLLFTIFRVYNYQNFAPTNATLIENLRQGLQRVITIGFDCLLSPSNPQCSTSSRRKRQLTPSYTVTIIPPITLLSSDSFYSRYRVNYTVTDSSGVTRSATAVLTAIRAVSEDQRAVILGFPFEGDFAQSPISPDESPATDDRKLWIIGAVLGPVVFTLLLVGLACLLRGKCRSKGNNLSTAQAVYNAPQLSARTSNYQTIHNEPILQQATPVNNVRVLAQSDPLVGSAAPPRRLAPMKLHITSDNIPQYPAPVAIPMQEIRRQNDVDRWRNKLRLQEKFEQRYADPLTELDQLHNSSSSGRRTSPTARRSIPYQYDNRAFESDPSNTFMQPVNELNLFDQTPTTYSPRRTPQMSEIEAGRTKLHRLLDDVLDKAEPNATYDPDSESERRRRRQQRRIHSASYDPRNPLVLNDNQQIPHTSMPPQVSERPDPSLLRFHPNPYEAGDRAYEIQRTTPANLEPKYSSDDRDIRQRYMQTSHRSNPPLFYDDSVLANRPMTAVDVYGAQRRPETDHDSMMRPNGHRQHKFDTDAVYIDTIPKNRDGSRAAVHNAWSEQDNNYFHLNPSDINTDPSKRNDYRDEYIMAKRSVVSTKNLISSIHDELQQIVSHPSSENYQA